MCVKKTKCEREVSQGGEGLNGDLGGQEGQRLGRWRSEMGTLTGVKGHQEAPLQLARPQPSHPPTLAGGQWEDSPRTRFSGSLMLTVCSWEADRELLMERSAVGPSRRNLRQRPPTLKTSLPRGRPHPSSVEGLPRKVLDPESQRVPEYRDLREVRENIW